MKKINDPTTFFPKKKATILAASIAAVLGAGFIAGQANAGVATKAAQGSPKSIISDQTADGAGTSVMVWLEDADGNHATNGLEGNVTLKDATGTLNTVVPFPAGLPYITIDLGGLNGEPLGTVAANTLEMIAEYANGVSNIAASSQMSIAVKDDFLTASINDIVFDGSRPASTDAFDGFKAELYSKTPLGDELTVSHMVKNTGSSMAMVKNHSVAKLNGNGTLPVILADGTGNISSAHDEFYVIGDAKNLYGQAVVPNQGNDTISDITGGGAFSVNPVTGDIVVVNSSPKEGVCGTSTDGDAPQMSRTVNQSDILTIGYTYNIDPTQQGQPASLMMIGAYIDTQGLYQHLASVASPYPVFIYNKLSDDTWKIWVQGIDTLKDLASYENVPSLGATQSYDIYTGPTTGMPGQIALYPAYQLENGLIIYPVKTININVNP
ncbi:MAG: hypothetical protein GY862_25640 [Gammaproteobacteria bacterium]|nr:hypothetical protein [Gammaproteobacteria bacterium]